MSLRSLLLSLPRSLLLRSLRSLLLDEPEEPCG
jgi:hypothetical protein